ncbi:MAG: DUF1874 domain-containing protein [Clostridia bacterium]|nr:DUF1874 domain-containing protein [Clostridia bacterium]
MNYLANAFSLNMLEVEDLKLIRVMRVPAAEVPIDAVSVIGHPDTASLLSSYLDRKVEVNRTTLTLTTDDVLYVAQYRGPRLPEGATELPNGASLVFFEVTLMEECENLQ